MNLKIIARGALVVAEEYVPSTVAFLDLIKRFFDGGEDRNGVVVCEGKR